MTQSVEFHGNTLRSWVQVPGHPFQNYEKYGTNQKNSY